MVNFILKGKINVEGSNATFAYELAVYYEMEKSNS